MAETVEERKVFVGGISSETTDEKLTEYFSKYGRVVNVNVPVCFGSGSRKGFAFVTFSKSSEASLALQNSHEILGRKVDVKRAIPRAEQHSENSSPRKIFVGGLPSNLTDEEFKDYFERFGTITDIVVIRDNINNRPRGFGFVEFHSKDAANEVLKNVFHELKGKRVEVKKAIPKDGGYEELLHSGFQYGNNVPYAIHSYPNTSGAFGLFYYPGYQYVPNCFPYMFSAFGDAYTIAGGGYARIAPYVAWSPYRETSLY